MADTDQSNLTVLTIDLLSAFVANNTVEHAALPELIKSTHAALKVIDAPEPDQPEEPEYKPAVSVRKSLSSDSHIISLIDGKPYQTLKRHLSKHGLTADQYRERYGLAASYPMVSKAYSASRRAIAEKLGLGGRVKGGQASAPTAAAPASAAPPAKPKQSSTRAPKIVAAQAETAAPTKVKAAPKPKAPAKADAPATAKASEKKATITPAAGAPTASAPAKSAPKARKAAAPKQEATPAPAGEKPASRKRTAKAAAPAT